MRFSLCRLDIGILPACVRWTLLLLAWWLAITPCHALVTEQAAVDLQAAAASGDAPLEIVETMRVLLQPIGQVSPGTSVLDQPGWKPATVVNRNGTWRRSAVWLTGLVTNQGTTPLQRWIVVSHWRIDTVELMTLDPVSGQLLSRTLAGRSTLVGTPRLDHVEPLLPLELAPGQTVRLLIRAQDLSVPTTQVSVWQPEAYARHLNLRLLREAVTITVALLVLTLLLWSRDPGLIALGCWLVVGVGFESTFNGQLLVYLMPALAAWIIPLFTLLGALGTGVFALATKVLLDLPLRERWTALMLGNALLTLLVALTTPFVADHAVPRMVVSTLGVVCLLLWPLATWCTSQPLDAGQRQLRRMLTLCAAVLAVYVVMARGGVQPAWMRVLQDWIRLDLITLCATILVHSLMRRRASEAAHQRTEFLAFHDALTGLPNRLRARERLQQELDRIDESGSDHAVAALYLDLDKFKQINDTHGHAQGDRLLCEVARRMTDCIGPAGIVCRLSGDEFMIIAPQTGAEATQALAHAEALQETLARPFLLDDGLVIHASCSVGLAVTSTGGGDAETLMRHADAALYEAKRQGERRPRLFSPPMLERLTEQVRIRDALHQSLRQNHFELHYQPQQRLRDGRIIGVEALLRWKRPDGTVPAPPDRFIPIAEESGLIEPIGTWVLNEACRQAAGWPDLTVAVNVSAVQFRSGCFAQQVERALATSGLPAHRLELELTESVLIGHEDMAPLWLQQLRAMGVKLAIDDFGTGYSSLSYLHRFRVDRLKIDRAFIRRMEQANDGDSGLIASVVQIAHQLGLETVAEGAESTATFARLALLGCDAAQGYAIARPMPADAMTHWLVERGVIDPGLTVRRA